MWAAAALGCLAVALCADRYAMRNLTAGRAESYPAQFYDAYIDNFDPYNSKTYSQRYYVNQDVWNKDPYAPIFLEIGGEGAIYGPPSGQDEVAALAAEHGGIVIALEHRFYGASQPFDDLKTEHLKFLDDRQALEDVVHFIDFYDKSLHPNEHVAGSPKNKWVLVGGSYPGALASWIRTKYPHLSKCSLASSGVVEAIYKFTAFDEQIAASAGDQCASLLRQVTKKMESQIDQTSDRTKLFNKFGADPEYDVGDFFYYMADSGVMAIQYGHTGELCDRLINAYNNNADLVDAYRDYVMNWLNPTMNPYGADTYDRRVMVDTSLPAQDFISRQWQYQTCARFSWFQNAPSLNSIRSTKYLNFDYFLNLCKAVFNKDMDPEVDNVNNFYGGKSTKATNVFYANYWQDPWHHASPDEGSLDGSLNSPVRTVKCADCGHCQDMHAPKNTDPAELTAVREEIRNFINTCLAD